MNTSIFNNYNDVETAFNNDLHAFYTNAKTMKARTLKGTSYWFKSGKTGKKYDISAEECRILNLFYNTLNALNKAQQADNMMSYYNGNVWWFERAELRREVIEMVNGYIDAFEAWLNEKNVAETVETASAPEVETETTSETTTTVAPETETVATTETTTETSESETTVDETSEAKTTTEEVDIDALIEELRDNDIIFDDDKISVNEDEYEITVDIYRNGQWCDNIVLYEFA